MSILFKKKIHRLIILALTVALLSGFAGLCLADQISDEAASDTTGEAKVSALGYSSITLDYQDILKLPVRTLDELINLQNSAVDVPQSGSVVTEFHIRGGRHYSHRFYLNGLAFNNPISGQLSATVSPRMIGQLSYNPGGSPAQYGNAEESFFDIISRSGGRKYSGAVEIMSDNVGRSRFDQNWYTVDLSGPIPALDKGSFFGFIERRWLGDRKPSAVTSDVLPDSPDRLPGNWQEGWSYHGRVDYPFTENLSMIATADYIEDEWSEYQHVFLFDIDHTPRYRNKNLGLSAKLHHTPTPIMSYSLGASYFKSERITGDGTLFDDLDAYQRYFANPTFYEFPYFREGEYPIRASDADPNVEPGSPGDTIIHVQSYYDYFRLDKSAYIALAGNLKRQIDNRNTIRAGVNFKRYTLRCYENNEPTAVWKYHASDVNRYGFTIDGEESDDLDYRNDTKHPTNLSLSIEDRFELEGMVINAGFRYVRYDYNTLQFIDLLNPLDPGNATGVDTLDRGDLENAPSFDYILPRFGLSTTIGDKFKLRINYGKYVQRPPFQYTYVGYDYVGFLLVSGKYSPLSVKALEPEKTTQYEIGGTWAMGHSIVLDAVAFYRDMDNQVTIWHVAKANPFVYDVYDNENVYPSVAKGIEFRLTAERTKNLQLDLKYSLSWVGGIESYPESDIHIMWHNPLATFRDEAPLDYDRTHDIAGTIVVTSGKGKGPRLGKIYPFENTILRGVFYARSGRPFTLNNIFDEVVEVPVNWEPREEVNGENRPWTFSIDLKLERAFTIGEFQITPFVWVKNLLDRKNVTDVWTSSGETNTTLWLGTEDGMALIDEYPEFASIYQLKENDPTHYAPPRQIYFGMRVSF